MTSVRELKRTMRAVFGVEQFRPGQEDVIRSVLKGRDTLAIMPTGSGKSLCHQLPGLHLEGTTVVISPLISLITDQTDKLVDQGVAASQINSAVPASEADRALADIWAQFADATVRVFKREFLWPAEYTSIVKESRATQG